MYIIVISLNMVNCDATCSDGLAKISRQILRKLHASTLASNRWLPFLLLSSAHKVASVLGGVYFAKLKANL